MSTSRTLTRSLAGAAAVAALLVGPVAAAPASAAPYCGIYWGSLAETASAMSSNTVSNVRAGRHACFDRLVIDLSGTRATGFDVRYVPQVRTDGAGTAVPLRGAADLRIVVRAPAYTSGGRATYLPRNRSEVVDVSGFRTFRQVAWAGSFEGQTTIGLGVRARLPFRTFTLTDTTAGTTRLVIDVAHRW